MAGKKSEHSLGFGDGNESYGRADVAGHLCSVAVGIPGDGVQLRRKTVRWELPLNFRRVGLHPAVEAATATWWFIELQLESINTS